MAYKIPYTFVPGTKAKANEVNSNFSKVAEYFTELNTGLSSTSLDVTDLQTKLNESTQLLKEGRTKFCVNEASGTLLTTASNIVYFNSSFTLTDYKGNTSTISSVPAINCSSFNDGVHNIFVTTDGVTQHYKNTIYAQNAVPTSPLENDIWVNSSKEPIFVGKYDGSSWNEFLLVPVGSVEIENNSVKTLKIFPFNQNGYNINSNSVAVDGSLAHLKASGRGVISSNSICDYSTSTTIVWNTLYTAATNGLLFVRGYLSDNKNFSVQIGTTSALGNTVAYSYLTDTNNTLQFIIPIPKDYYYKVTGSGSNIETKFYRLKGDA